MQDGRQVYLIIYLTGQKQPVWVLIQGARDRAEIESRAASFVHLLNERRGNGGHKPQRLKIIYGLRIGSCAVAERGITKEFLAVGRPTHGDLRGMLVGAIQIACRDGMTILRQGGARRNDILRGGLRQYPEKAYHVVRGTSDAISLHHILWVF